MVRAAPEGFPWTVGAIPVVEGAVGTLATEYSYAFGCLPRASLARRPSNSPCKMYEP